MQPQQQLCGTFYAHDLFHEKPLLLKRHRTVQQACCQQEKDQPCASTMQGSLCCAPQPRMRTLLCLRRRMILGVISTSSSSLM
jgi:hypothetical protein